MGRGVDAAPLYTSPQISVQQNCLKPVFGETRRKGLSPSLLWLFRLGVLRGRTCLVVCTAAQRALELCCSLQGQHRDCWVSTGLVYVFLCPFHALVSTLNKDEPCSKHGDVFFPLPRVMGGS